jgi:hypothetical protein
MRPRPKLALFLSGLFFGGGLDHLIFIAMNSPISHYGLHVGVSGQLGFAALDFSIAAVLFKLGARWGRIAAAV